MPNVKTDLGHEYTMSLILRHTRCYRTAKRFNFLELAYIFGFSASNFFILCSCKFSSLFLQVTHNERLDGHAAKLPFQKSHLPRAKDQISTTRFVVSSSSTSYPMNIHITTRRQTHLNNTRYSGVINTTSRDVGSNKDRCSGIIIPEMFGNRHSPVHIPLRVHLVHPGLATRRKDLTCRSGDEFRE